MLSNDVWTKSKTACLYRYKPTGQYFARCRHAGKLHRRKLNTTDYQLARGKLADFKRDLQRTDASRGNASFAEVLDAYSLTLKGARSTVENKRAIVAKLRKTFFGVGHLPLRTIKPTAVEAWLAEHYGDKSASSHNQAVTVIRVALAKAVNDRIITESPAVGLQYRKPTKRLRPTPTFEQFKQIVADIRAQRFNADAQESANFVSFLGLTGQGQAEASSLTAADVDLAASRIIIYRHKTDVGFTIPVFPQLRPLLEKLCKGKKPHQRLFTVKGARKAIAGACKRLGFLRETSDGRLVAQFTHRSLRRMFITNALEKGIDVQTVSRWVGHRDGGRLILSVYGDVRGIHSQRMAQLLIDGEPENVVPITAAKA